MRRVRTVLAATLLTVLGVAPAAVAEPPHGEGGHTHHVHTPEGCVDTDQVVFFVEDRGMHRAGNSSGFEKGVWHGSCH